MAYASAPTTTRNNGIAVAGFVLSLLGLFIFSFILGPIGLILSGVGLSRANRGAGNRGLAIAGVVLGVIDIVLFGVLVAAASHGGVTWHI